MRRGGSHFKTIIESSITVLSLFFPCLHGVDSRQNYLITILMKWPVKHSVLIITKLSVNLSFPSQYRWEDAAEHSELIIETECKFIDIGFGV